MTEDQDERHFKVLNRSRQASDNGSPWNLARNPDNKDPAYLLVQDMFRRNAGIRTAQGGRDGALAVSHGPNVYIHRTADADPFSLKKTLVLAQDLLQYL